ncbi:MAG: acyltransferase [Pseudomonadota bacterium]
MLKSKTDCGGLAYRTDIDGLRALAVLSVVLFHVGAPLSGGFVGVDVFFVLSGYLITHQLRAQPPTWTTLRTFYLRRARRLLPALYVVLFTTLAAGILWLLPHQLVALTEALTWTLGFGANVHFAGRSGYFAPAAELMPLLHTWSLAVEEQFYFVFPLVLFGARRVGRRWAYAAVALAAAVSFVYAVWLGLRSPSDVFYASTARVWELAVGALATWIVVPRDRRWAHVGLVLLFASFIAIASTQVWHGLRYKTAVGCLVRMGRDGR